MDAEYKDRFDQATYVDDEPVRLFRVGGDATPVDGRELYMPERIWDRIRLIATAYDLHLLPLFDGSVDPVMLNAQQVETLLGELDFVAKVTADPLIRREVDGIAQLVQRPPRPSREKWLGIDFP